MIAMNLILHLPPETEARLIEQATLEGKEPETLALEALEDRLSAPGAGAKKRPLQEWLRELNEAPTRLPPGNPEADFGRESIYEGRGG
jgi:hypothetical protein